jgi:chitodextrinase
MRFRRAYLFLVMVLVLAIVMPTTPALSRPKHTPKPTPTVTPTPSPSPTPTANPSNTCSTSTPSSGAYTVTICFTAPGDGSVVSGDTTVSATVSVSGTNPGIARVAFTINGYQLITDFQSPYTFILPTTKWQDGSYGIEVEAIMRDAYVTANQAIINISFSNGNNQPPVNHNSFMPTSGTTPANGAPFIVAAAGDGADGAVNAENVTNQIAAINPNLFLYLGDVYLDGTVTEFYNWYGTGNYSYSRFLPITDPTIGNHEYIGSSAAGYFDYWNNIPDYYSFDAGGWHFVSLNSNSSHIGVDINSAQYAWLQQDLAANANSCTIVYYHHPLFNIGPEGATTAMSDIWALMAQNDVSIVLNGHDHDYQRWVPLDANGNPSPTGVTEFVAGGGGHGLQTIAGSDSRVAFWDDTNPEAFGVLVLALNSSGANFQYVNSSGAILDSGVVPCTKGGDDTQAPADPTGVTASAISATQVNLTWQASTDNVGVAGYDIYRDGAILATVPASSLAYSDYSGYPSTTYSYSIDAYDLAGNYSAQSSPVGVTTPAMQSSLLFNVGADTYVNAGSPTYNYGSATVWRVDYSPDLHSYLRFTVQGLAGYPIYHAYLKVYANTNSSYGINLLSVADNSWDENSVTYNTAPALGTVLGTSSSFTSGTWVSFDVTPYVTGEGTYSFGVTTPGSSTVSFAAKESGINAAQLEVDLVLPDSEAPSVPTGLTANASSATQVDLSWQASSDNIGVEGYTIYRDGAVLATVAGSTLSYTDSTVSPSTAYAYSLAAFDVAGNYSVQSSPANVTTPAMPASLTFGVGADTYVNSNYPNNNYGSATVWRVDGSPDIHAYLQFTLQGLAGFPVQHAYLMVYANSNSNIGINVLGVADNSWDENTVTYSTAPALGNLLTSSSTFKSGTWVTIDVSSYITGEGTYSFGITTPGSSTLSFSSKESGANAAILEVDLAIDDTQAPSVPTGLTASASSATQVDLSWQASTDNVGVAGYTIYRDNAVLDTVSGSMLNYTDSTVTGSMTYTYNVDAFDAAGNYSAQSSPVSVTTPAIPSSMTFDVSADTYVNAAYPDSNYGTATSWRVDGSPDTHALLKFTVQGTGGTPIQHAYLTVYANSGSSVGINVASVSDNTWDEYTVSYNTAPALGSLLASSSSFGSGTWLTFDVSAFITGDGTYSFAILTPGSTAISFASKESGVNYAQLTLDFP